MLCFVGLGFVVLGIGILFYVLKFTALGCVVFCCVGYWGCVSCFKVYCVDLGWIGLGFIVLGVDVLFHVKRLEHFQIRVIFFFFLSLQLNVRDVSCMPF